MTIEKQSTSDKQTGGFTSEERDAMKARAHEVKRERTRGGAKADGESELLAKIAAMPEKDRSLAERVHTIIRSAAPDLEPKTWYGMPAYAKSGQTICFFRNAGKFKTRYATLGFSDKANLDDGTMWPTDFAILGLTPEVETRITELIRKAVS